MIALIITIGLVAILYMLFLLYHTCSRAQVDIEAPEASDTCSISTSESE